jgi:hypothetical protein
MIERSRRKLDEARFFYGHLVKERQRKIISYNPREFRFYFSAFIQAARSVTWTLGSEEPDRWRAWEPKWKAERSDEEQKLLDLMNELRLDEAKRGGANALMEWEEEALHALLDLEPWRRHPWLPRVPQPKTFHTAYYFEHESGKEEVTALCKRYLDFLDKMLNDFCADNQPPSPE